MKIPVPSFLLGAFLTVGLSGAEENLRFSMVGDLMLGSEHPSASYALKDPGSLLAPWVSTFRSVDLAMGNLEGALADATAPVVKKGKNSYGFRMPVRTARALADSGFHLLNAANNHTLDCGGPGWVQTFSHLKAAGIEATGSRESHPVVERKGRRIAILGFSSYGHHPDINAHEESMGRIRAAKAAADLVVVTFHGGAEGAAAIRVGGSNEWYYGENRGNVRRFARGAVEAGADVVFGHGPHVLRGMEIWKGRLIAYSLGNFVGHRQFNVSGPFGTSCVLLAEIAKDGSFRSAEVRSAVLSVEGPTVPDPEGKAIALLNRLAELDFKETGLRFSPDGKSLPAP